MPDFPPISRELERFVARRILNFEETAWKELSFEQRKECILAARRALKAERHFFANRQDFPPDAG